MRSGHSLAELLVAMLVLVIGLGASAGAVGLGLRWTARAVALQEAAARAGFLLDSLAIAPEPASGGEGARGLAAEWQVVPAGRSLRMIRVLVRDSASGDTLVTQEGATFLPPRLPW